MKTFVFLLSLLTLVSCGDKDKGGGTSNAFTAADAYTVPKTQAVQLDTRTGTILIGSQRWTLSQVPNQIIIQAINLANSQGIYPDANGRYRARIVATRAYPYGQMQQQFPQQQQPVQNNQLVLNIQSAVVTR